MNFYEVVDSLQRKESHRKKRRAGPAMIKFDVKLQIGERRTRVTLRKGENGESDAYLASLSTHPFSELSNRGI